MLATKQVGLGSWSDILAHFYKEQASAISLAVDSDRGKSSFESRVASRLMLDLKS
jgi:hypothetical protein